VVGQETVWNCSARSTLRAEDQDFPLKLSTLPLPSTATQNDGEEQDTELSAAPLSIAIAGLHPLAVEDDDGVVVVVVEPLGISQPS
jgi:hypothetical protein